MSTLHGEPVHPNDRVYDVIDGWGRVESVGANCLFVTLGCRTRRRYSTDGFTGKRSSATLYWHRPPQVVFSKHMQSAEAQRKFLEASIALLNQLPQCADVTLIEPCDCGDDHDNCC